MTTKFALPQINTLGKKSIQMLDRLLFANLLTSGGASISLTQEQQQALQQFQSKLEQGIYSFEEVSCMCGDVDDYLIAKRDRYGLSFDTCLCKNCGLLRTRNRLDPESLSKFYDEDYRTIYGGNTEVTDAFFSEQIQHGRKIYNFITSNIEIASDSKVFDVGCGAGGILIPFKQAGWSTFGCDLGSNYLERGKAEGLLLKHGNINSLKEFGKADLVILSHVVEHFSDPIFELKRIRETLVDGGYLYVELPGIFAIHKIYGKTINFLQNAHLYHFTLGTLTSVLAQAGFKLVCGDENIHALFQKDDDVEYSLNSTIFQKILNYLYFVEIRKFLLPLLNILNRGRNILAKAIKRLFGERFFNYLKRILK